MGWAGPGYLDYEFPRSRRLGSAARARRIASKQRAEKIYSTESNIREVLYSTSTGDKVEEKKKTLEETLCDVVCIIHSVAVEYDSMFSTPRMKILE